MFGHSYTTFDAPAIFTTPDVPGRAVEASFGAVGVYSANAAITNEGLKKIFTEAFDELLRQATALGGNAVVGVHFSAWAAAFVVLGTAVRLTGPTPHIPARTEETAR